MIPEGQYGAGVVKIWDRGTYENMLASKPQAQTVTEGIEAGHVEVALRGRKLKGGFALIRMRGRGKKDDWLLIKKISKPVRIQPMATVQTQPPTTRRLAKQKIDPFAPLVKFYRSNESGK